MVKPPLHEVLVPLLQSRSQIAVEDIQRNACHLGPYRIVAEPLPLGHIEALLIELQECILDKIFRLAEADAVGLIDPIDVMPPQAVR